MSDDDVGGFGDMFVDEAAEKEQARLAEERNREVIIEVPRFAADGTKKDESSSLKLVHRPGLHHSLWGHLLWNAARHLIFLMDTGKIAVKGKSVLELGSGLAAPSLVACLNGARVVAATDYPDEELLKVVAENAAKVLMHDEATRVATSFHQERLDERITPWQRAHRVG